MWVFLSHWTKGVKTVRILDSITASLLPKLINIVGCILTVSEVEVVLWSGSFFLGGSQIFWVRLQDPSPLSHLHDVFRLYSRTPGGNRIVICYLFRNWFARLKFWKIMMGINFWNDLKGVPNILPTGLSMPLLRFSQDTTGFIIFIQVLSHSQLWANALTP